MSHLTAWVTHPLLDTKLSLTFFLNVFHPEHLKVKVTALSLWRNAFMEQKMEIAVM